MSDNQYVIDVSTNADTASVEELAAKLQEVEQSAQRVTDTLSNTDGSGLDSASDSASNAADNLERADEAANNFSNDVNNVDGSGLEDTANKADDASTSIDNASDSASGLSAVATGLASAGIVATMMSWADAGGNAQSQWTRMSLAMKNTGMTAEQIQSTYGKAVSALSSSTGRGAGDIREFFIQMGISGVTNTDILKSSFEGIAGSAFITGRSVDSLGEYFARLTKTGKLVPKQLASQFAMSLPEVGNAMRKLGYDVSNNSDDIQNAFLKMDETTRAKVLGTALSLKGGQQANDDYKKSWDGVKKQMEKAEGGFFAFAGTLLIPTLTVAFQLAADAVNAVTGAFKAAPAPVQGILGVIGTLAAGFIALVLAISTFRSIMGVLKVGQTIKDLKNLGTTVFDTGKSFLTSGKNALVAAGNYVKSGIMAAASAAKTVILTLATWAQVAAQAMLNFIMSLNPFTIIVIAILALVAVLIYLWVTNEQFRNAILGIWAAISGAFIYAGQQIYNTLLWIWNGIVWFLGLIPQLPLLIGLYLAAAVLKFVLFAVNAATGARNAGMGIVNAITSTISSIPGRMFTWGSQLLANFVNGIKSQFGALGGALQWISDHLPHSPPKMGPLSTITAANMFAWASDIAYAGTLGFSSLNLSGITTPNLSSGYGSASLGYDATEINNVLSANSNENSKAQIIQYIDLNGIMSEEEAATTIVNAIVEQAEKENLITGKS